MDDHKKPEEIGTNPTEVSEKKMENEAETTEEKVQEAAVVAEEKVQEAAVAAEEKVQEAAEVTENKVEDTIEDTIEEKAEEAVPTEVVPHVAAPEPTTNSLTYGSDSEWEHIQQEQSMMGNTYEFSQEGSRAHEQPPKTTNSFAIVSLALGIASILFGCCTGVGGLVLGALGIIFAILSRGKGTMDTQAKIGLGVSIGGAVLGLIITVIAVVFVTAAVGSSDFQQEFENELNKYGYSYDGGNYNQGRGDDPGFSFGHGDEFDSSHTLDNGL